MEKWKRRKRHSSFHLLRRETTKRGFLFFNLLQLAIVWVLPLRLRRHSAHLRVVWKTLSQAVEAKHEAIRVHARATQLLLSASFRSSRTHLAFAGNGRELMDPFQTVVLLSQRCNLLRDTWKTKQNKNIKRDEAAASFSQYHLQINCSVKGQWSAYGDFHWCLRLPLAFWPTVSWKQIQNQSSITFSPRFNFTSDLHFCLRHLSFCSFWVYSWFFVEHWYKFI